MLLQKRFRYYIVFISVAGVLASLLIYVAVNNLLELITQERFKRVLQHSAELIQQEVGGSLNRLKAHADWYEPGNPASDAKFANLTQNMVGVDSGFRKIDWVANSALESEPWRQQAGFAAGDTLQSSYLIYKPGSDGLLYMLVATRVTQNSVEVRAREVTGYIVAEYDIGGVFNQIFSPDEVRISARLVDLSGDSLTVLYQQPFWQQQDGLQDKRYTLPFKLFELRNWAIEAEPTAYYWRQEKGWADVVVLTSGLVLTAFILMSLNATSRRTEQIHELINRRTEQLHSANRQLEELTLTDALTGVLNRRGFDSALQSEWGRAAREGKLITLIVIDVDHFKAFNDHYGHIAGDDCLRRVAAALSDVPGRLGDIVARYGGEEFAVILPNTNDTAGAVAEKCRAAVEGLKIPHEVSDAAKVITVSAGVAILRPDEKCDSTELIRKADQAMYQAKRAGRNRVKVG